MSRWGEEIFNSDGASDYLQTLVRQIEKSINDCIKDQEENSLGPAFRGGEILMPAVDILRTLTKEYPDVILHMVEEMPIAQWREWYLDAFDSQPPDLVNPDFRKLQRELIVKSFKELESMVEN
jgi:hypothetical protein